MPLSLNKYILLFLILFSRTEIYSQMISPDKVRSLTVDDGLPQGFITGMVQDEQGFIWLSTSDGLARYDGRNVKVFYHDASDSNSLSTNVIAHLIIDKENNIWIQHENGTTDLLNPITEKFRHLTQEKAFRWLMPDSIAKSYRIFEGNNRNIYILCFNKRSDRPELKYFTWDHTSPKKIPFSGEEFPCFISEDKSGKLWLCSNKNLYVLENNRAKKISPLPAQLAVQLASPDLLDLRGGDIELTGNGGLLINSLKLFFNYNIQNNQWKKFEFPSYIKSLSNKAVQIAPDGKLYVAYNNKLFKINDHGNLTLIWKNELHPGNFWIMIDRSNVLWIATNTFGTRMIDLNNSGFNSVKNKNGFFYDVLPSEYKIPVENKHINTPKFENEGYNGRSNFDENGNLWIANFQYEKIDGERVSKNSLVEIKNNHAYVYNIENGSPTGKENSILNFVFDAKNRCWAILNDTNLVRVDLQYRQFSEPVRLSSGQIPSYLTSVDNNLWLVYPNALEKYDPDNGKMVWYKDENGIRAFQNAYLLMAIPDPHDTTILWVTSRGNGLIRFDTKTGIVKAFTTKDGLPNNTIYCVVADKDGYLWCSSNKGIFRFSPADYSVLSFTVKDGLQGNEFNRFQFIHFPGNKIAFGGTQGYTIFDPDSIYVDNYQPEVALTDIAINNEPISKYNKWKNKTATSIDSMRLAYDENFLTFHFGAMEYNDPEKMQYRYMLTGVDKKWINAGTQNSANYTNLSPGIYDLRLNASNTSGLWSSYIKTIHIVITPPWWKTWWAYTLYAVSIAVAIFLILRIHLKQVKSKHEMELKKKETEQLRALDEMKSRFFTNITHEFRTPLSLIISPVEQMQQDQEVTPFLKKRLSGIQRNAKQLLRLINQLLDLSKLESGNMKVALSRGEINCFIEETVQSFRQSSDLNQIVLEFHSSCPDKEYLFDTDKWEKILINLLSNAIKFTPEKGKIMVEISAAEKEAGQNMIHLRVSDTGSGIPQEKLPFIFQRFYQVDDSRTRKFEGSGIGLSLVKELTKLMNGSIEVTSEEGIGTAFDIFIHVADATNSIIPAWTKAVSFQESSPEQIISNDLITNHQDKNSLPVILVVEDNRELCEFICESLDKNYRTLAAPNGKEGLRLAKEILPGIIISDVLMPEMDGFTFCREIKSSIETEHIAVILLTAKAAHESVIEGLKVGADDYLTKPFHFDELQLRINNILKRQEKLRMFFKNQLSNPNVVLEKSTIQNDFITHLYSILEEYLDDCSLNVDKLAMKAAVSHRTLNRKLSTLIGLSANELIKQYRLKRSIEFLKSGHNVSETAYSVGFETHSHFTTSFKSFFGVTPTEYINTMISK